MTHRGERSADLPHERGHRTRHARTFLAIAFLLQRLGDAAVLWFVFEVGTSGVDRGLAIGGAVWSAALLVAAWRRLGWGRHLLTIVNWGYIFAVSFRILQQSDQIQAAPLGPHLAFIAGPVLYLAANVILIRSRRVRHFANK